MSTVSSTWITTAVSRLLAMREDMPGWGYQGGSSPYTEPTAIGCLALLAGSDELPCSDISGMVAESAAWLADLQQPDGALGIAPEFPQPQWPTAYAALLWCQCSGFERTLAAALRWLQQREGHTFVKTKECVLGHDTSIPGWPWVAGTHPWLEPTAISMLALCRNQLAGHQRIRDGVRMILDRAIASGGWNVGNSSAFGRELRPAVGSTGLALLALRAAEHEETPSVTRGCDYLLDTLPHTRSPESLSWGLLGLQAWRPRPAEADQWLEESFNNPRALQSSPMRLALLLLAASHSTLTRLGVEPLSAPAQTLAEVLAP